MYKSVIDYKIYNLVMLFTIASISPIFFAEFSTVIYIVIGIVLASLWLTHTVFHGVRYTINVAEQSLLVKIGFFSYGTYDIMKVRSIKKSNSWLSSPAASLDRIELKIKFTPLIISPENRAQFIADLLSINPEIQVAERLRSHEKE